VEGKAGVFWRVRGLWRRMANDLLFLLARWDEKGGGEGGTVQ
jgi:hypothetical protein